MSSMSWPLITYSIKKINKVNKWGRFYFFSIRQKGIGENSIFVKQVIEKK